MSAKINKCTALCQADILKLVTENISVHEIKFDVAMEMIYKGEIRDSKTISGLFMVRHWRKNRLEQII